MKCGRGTEKKVVGYRIDRSKATCSGAEGPTEGHRITLAVHILVKRLEGYSLTQDFDRNVVNK